jgi:hypothetical protein
MVMRMVSLRDMAVIGPILLDGASRRPRFWIRPARAPLQNSQQGSRQADTRGCEWASDGPRAPSAPPFGLTGACNAHWKKPQYAKCVY